MSMKYLWTLTLLAVSVGLMAGAAVAQDSWAVATEYDEDEEEDVRLIDLPTGMVWDATYSASVEAENTGTTVWTAAAPPYALLSVVGSTLAGVTAVDRWGLTEVALTANVPTGAVNAFAFTITAPPIVGTFECDWVMGNNGVPFLTDLAEADVALHRFPDILPGTAGEWCADFVEQCAGRVPPIVLGYPDGLYRPHVGINRDAMAVYIRRGMMIPQVFPPAAEYDEEEEEWTFNNTFPDVPFYARGDSRNHWAVGDIEALAAEEVVFGYGDGSYQPGLGVTRAQMAVFIARGTDYFSDVESYYEDGDPVEGESLIEEDVFPDVPATFWAAPEIQACVDADVVAGYPDGYYRPSGFVDRGQMSVYAKRAFIAATAVVVLGGPGVTDVPLDPLPDYHGWSSVLVDPDSAYLEFDPAGLNPDLAVAGTGTWDIMFYFAAMATPTDTPETVTVEDTAMVALGAGDLTGLTGDYFTVAADIPTMTPGMKLLWATVETPTGAAYMLPRTVIFEQSEPPPPPGAPRVPNAIGADLWLAASVAAGDDPPGWGSGYETYSSGIWSNMKFSDDQYFTLVDSRYPIDDADSPSPGDDWLDCCWGDGFTLKWTGFEIPVGATEMKVKLEYHVYDPQDGTGMQNYPCSGIWCLQDDDKPNFCEAWFLFDQDDAIWAGIDNVHPPHGWGLVMLNFTDCWDWTNAEIQDTPAEGAYGGAFAYHPSVEPTVIANPNVAMEWTVSDWSDFVQVGPEGNEAAIHWCGGSIYKLVIDVCTLEFNPH